MGHDVEIYLFERCYGLWGKGIAHVTCVVLASLPHLHELLLPLPALEIRYVNRP